MLGFNGTVRGLWLVFCVSKARQLRQLRQPRASSPRPSCLPQAHPGSSNCTQPAPTGRPHSPSPALRAKYHRSLMWVCISLSFFFSVPFWMQARESFPCSWPPLTFYRVRNEDRYLVCHCCSSEGTWRSVNVSYLWVRKNFLKPRSLFLLHFPGNVRPTSIWGPVLVAQQPTGTWEGSAKPMS